MKINLTKTQIKILKNWVIEQTYLTIEEVESFKQSFRDYGIKIKENDFDMIYECCPFGFIINRIDEYDLIKNK